MQVRNKILAIENNAETIVQINEVLCGYFNIEVYDGNHQSDTPSMDGVALVLLNPDIFPEGSAAVEEIICACTDVGIPVLVITDGQETPLASRALSLGASDVIRTPLSEQVTLRRILNYANMRSILVSSGLSTVPSHGSTDALTGIYNKQGFYSAVAELFKSDSCDDCIISVFDIYRFKIINELFSTNIGDKILRMVAATADNIVKVGFVGRLEADRFAICMPYCDNQAFERIVNMINEAVNSILPEYETVIYFGAYRPNGRRLSPQLMCDRAIIALNSIKGNYGVHMAFYNEALRESILKEQTIIGEMTTALEGGQFQVYLQPIFNLTQNRYSSAEVLVRWIHPQRGVVSPGEFIPVFEKTGYIIKLDMHVWEEVCKLIQRWKSQELPLVPLSVNVSPLHLNDPNFVNDFSALLARYDIEHNEIMLEITESAYVRTERSKAVINELREQGYTILMDDFGSGYSSFNMLKDVNIDILKIDMGFIRDLDRVPKAQTILTTIVRMAKWLDLPVVAEGVETKEQSDFLHSIGCTHIQGYYYARPMPVSDYEKIISKSYQTDILPAQIDFKNFNMDSIMDVDPRMQLLWNSMVIGLGICEMKGDDLELLKVNKAYYEITGLTPEIMHESESTLSHVHEADRSRLLRACHKVCDENDIENVQIRRYRADGTMVWCEYRIKLLGYSDDRAELCFTISDITDRKTFENDKISKNFHDAATQMFTYLLEYDLESDVFVVKKYSKNGTASTGEAPKSFEDTLRLSLENIHPEDREIFANFFNKENIFKNLSVSRVFTSPEHRFKNGDDYIWCIMTVIRLDRSRIVIGSTDVTKRHNESALNESMRLQSELNNELNLILDRISSGVAVFTMFGDSYTCTYANSLALKLLGIDSKNEITALLPDDAWKSGDAMINGELRNDCRFKHVRPNGSIIWIKTSVATDPSDPDLRYMTLTDVTQTMQDRMDIQTFIERQNLVDETANVIISDYDIINDVMIYTRGLHTLLRIDNFTEYLENPTFIHPYDHTAYKAVMLDTKNGPLKGSIEYHADFDGSGFKCYRSNYVRLTDENGVCYRTVSRLDCIETEEKLRILAETDMLTDVLNRGALTTKINDFYANSDLSASCTLILLDIDNFKLINDTHGHQFGDEVLARVSELIKLNFPEVCTRYIGRLGGDEFCIFIEGKPEEYSIKASRKMIEELHDSPFNENLTEKVTCCIGIAHADVASETSYSELYHNADIALYRAKAAGKNRCEVFTDA